uniref:Uncharacterized protein n=1 Tax=Chenopodium quinoa TaxID=63459 RepID=A0A803LZ82_CHEQI
MEHLKEVLIYFQGPEYGDELAINHEDLLEKLLPRPNLKGVQLWGYQVSSMSNLMYMETIRSSDYAQAPSEFTFFPSLEELSISYSPKLKGWWEGDQQLVDSDGRCWQPSFKRLFELSILVCPKLESFPPCPSVRILSLSKLDKNFKIMEFRDGNGYSHYRPSALRTVDVFENIGYLKSLSMSSVTGISITWDKRVERLSEVKEAFRSCSSSLRRLKIRGCDNLRSVSEGLEYLTVLESLSIIECPVLTFSEEDDSNGEDGMPWGIPSSEPPFLRVMES